MQSIEAEEDVVPLEMSPPMKLETDGGADVGADEGTVLEDVALNSDRAKMLRARYGHVAPGALTTSKTKYHLHIRVDERAVNQGLCFYNAEQGVYYMRSRRSCPLNQLPKEIISMDLERPVTPTGHTHVEFCVIGKRW